MEGLIPHNDTCVHPSAYVVEGWAKLSDTWELYHPWLVAVTPSYNHILLQIVNILLAYCGFKTYSQEYTENYPINYCTKKSFFKGNK